MITVAQITGINPNSKQAEILYVTSGRHYRRPEAQYMPLISEEPSFNETLFAPGATEGSVTVGWGDLVLSNIDGRLDRFRFYGFDGQPIKIWKLADEDEPISDSNLYFSDTMLYAQFETDKTTFFIRNRLQELAVAMQPALFVGDNVGVTGLEGDTNLASKSKPMSYGMCLNVPLVEANKYAQMYSCNYSRLGVRRKIAAVAAVYDVGGRIYPQGDTVDSVTLLAATVGAGYYKTCLAEGLIKFGSTPNGPASADIYESYGNSSSAARIVRRILEQEAGWVAGIDFDSGALDRLHVLNSCPVQLYVDDSSLTILDAISNLLNSIGAWMAPDSSRGRMTFDRMDLPSNNPVGIVQTISDRQVEEKTLRRIMTGDDSKGIPAKQVELLHTRIWTVIGQALPSISTDLREFLSKQFRSSKGLPDGDNSVHKLAPSLQYTTLLVGEVPIKVENNDFSKAMTSGVPERWNAVLGPGATAVAAGSQLSLTSSVGGLAEVYQNISISADRPTEVFSGTYIIEFNLISGNPANLGVGIGQSNFASTDLSVMAFTSPTVTGKTRFEFNFNAPSLGVGFWIRFRNLAASNTLVLSNVRVYRKPEGLTPNQEAARRGAIAAANVERFTFDINYNLAKLARPGTLVNFQFPRFGFTAGKKVLVIGRNEDLSNEMVTLDIFSG